MDLREFISATLVQIVNGVSDAQTATKIVHEGGKIQHSVNPRPTGGIDAAKLAGHMVSTYGHLIHNIDFDVAVTVESSSDAKLNGGIKVVGIGFGSSVSGTDRNTSVSRVKFQVPLALPSDRLEK